MRKYLITSFFCAECGKQLEILTESEIEKKWAWANDVCEENITGAENEYTTLYIPPCQWCTLRHTAPAKMVAEGLKRILEMEDK